MAALTRLAALLALTGLLALTVELFASVGRGYLAGFGGLIALVVAPQIAIVVGAGAWFPWSAPALWAIAPLNPGFAPVANWHLLVVPLAAIITGELTLAWWQTAELRWEHTHSADHAKGSVNTASGPRHGLPFPATAPRGLRRGPRLVVIQTVLH